MIYEMSVTLKCMLLVKEYRNGTFEQYTKFIIKKLVYHQL